MAKMCPMAGCKANHGMCMHDKMMVMMGFIAMALAGAHWGLHLF